MLAIEHTRWLVLELSDPPQLYRFEVRGDKPVRDMSLTCGVSKSFAEPHSPKARSAGVVLWRSVIKSHVRPNLVVFATPPFDDLFRVFHSLKPMQFPDSQSVSLGADLGAAAAYTPGLARASRRRPHRDPDAALENIGKADSLRHHF